MYSNFKHLLEEKKVTPYQVAKATGISQSTLSDWKTGRAKPKADKLLKLAEYFGVTVDYFLKEEK
ncbi:MAG: helix-turn-helix transcriptional regulator [Oscillospiraceae bacterium]|nr:helix-turn-helix transcriptional regulator [Oscillospiraceae bacterium]